MIEELAGVDLERACRVGILVLARTAPLAFLAPWLGVKGTATFVRFSVAVVLAVVLLPMAMRSAPAIGAGWLTLSLLALREALVGAAFAVAVSAPIYALGWTGELIDRWRGSPADGSVSGPAGRSSPLGTLHLGASVVLFVMLGGHRLALASFAEALVHLPPGAGSDAAGFAAFALGSARIVGDALALALAFLAPAAVVLLVFEVVLGLSGRVAPAIRVWMDAMSLRAALGIFVALLSLSALLPRLGPVFERSISTASSLLREL